MAFPMKTCVVCGEEFELKPEEQEGEVATADAQAVPGEMVEPTESDEAAASQE